MKNLAILLSLFTFAANAQSIDVLAENSTIEFSGGTYYINSSIGQDVNLSLTVRNNTGVDQDWELERVLPAMPHWDDWSMSWSPYSNPLAGNDFLLDQMTPNWITQITVPVPQDDSLLMVLRYEPLTDGCDLFQYYILQDDIRVDSFNINICKTASQEELDAESVVVFPNPSNLEINVVFPNGVPDQVVVFDLLGNKIANMEAFNSMRIPTIDFSNGMYLLSWNEDGIIRNKKFQVQHSN